jgi:hypothetical protein
MLDRRIEELLDLGEDDDLVEFAFDLDAAHAEDRAVQEDVFATGQFGMKSGANLEQAGHTASKCHPPSRRFGDAAQDLEQRAFARAVAADNSQDLALLDLETDILERPEFLDLVALNGLSSANNVDSFTGNVADLTPNYVAEPYSSSGFNCRPYGPPSIFWTGFRR